VEDVYEVYRSFASEPPKRLPRPGHLIADRHVKRLFVTRLFVLPFVRSKLPHNWVEIISENNRLQTGSVCLAELEDGKELSLARADSCKAVEYVIEVVRLDTPILDNGRTFRFSIREGFGSKNALTDCVRQNVMDCQTEELARANFSLAVEDGVPKFVTVRTNFQELNDAKWRTLRDVYRKSVDAAEKATRRPSGTGNTLAWAEARAAFAYDAYRMFGLKFPPVDTYSAQRLKNLRRRPAKMDEMDRRLISGFTTGKFQELSYAEIAAHLSAACGRKISPQATKKRCQRLRLPKRPPGPRSR
jgi:hypothetical protein